MSEEKEAIDGMFETENLDDLDSAIEKRLSRPTLTKRMKKKKETKKIDDMSFSAELEKYWYLYALLFVSALFTGTLGIYMGLAPTKTETGVWFNTDPMHIALAVVYLVSFVSVTEGAFALGKYLFFRREEENKTQKNASRTMMIIAGASIMLTGIAGGMVIASNISFLTKFVEIPEAAQTWVIVVIPILLTVYTFLLTGYHLSSDEAANERIVREKEREQKSDYKFRRQLFGQIADEALQGTELKLLQRLVEEGKITASQARARLGAAEILKNPQPSMASDAKKENLPNE